jgi:TonB family protein
MGISRKLLLLPAGIVSRMSDVQLDSVIAHEFAHMRRNDFLKNLLYELVSLPVNSHPAVWFTRDRIDETREIVCDELAAEHVGRASYSRSLLHLASLLIEVAPPKTAHAIGIFNSKVFERRLMKLAENQPQLPRIRRLLAIAACLTLSIATCASAVALHMQVNSTDATPQQGRMRATSPTAVRSDIMEKQLITKVVPEYPEEAKKAAIQGKVVLSAIVDKEGNPARLTVDSGPKELQASALEAVRQWKYKPFLVNGQPVEVATKVTINYTLAKKSVSR